MKTLGVVILIGVLLLSISCLADVKKPGQDPSFFFGIREKGDGLIKGIVRYEKFGTENISLDWFTKTGIGYSLNGGFIDTTHIGECCLWTQYLEQELYEELKQGDKSFDLKINKPNLEFHIKIGYPKNPTNEDLKKISVELAGYLVYNWCVIHEAMSWYGYKSTGLVKEFESAFSPEDLYSDVLGIHIAQEALSSGEDFDVACLKILKEKMGELKLQNSSMVNRAIEKIIGNWWNGKFWPRNKVWVRNWDIGLDGNITSLLVKEISKEKVPISLPVPKIPQVAGYVIKVEVEADGKQAKKLLKLAGKGPRDNLVLQDFKKIMPKLRKEAEKKLKH